VGRKLLQQLTHHGAQTNQTLFHPLLVVAAVPAKGNFKLIEVLVSISTELGNQLEQNNCGKTKTVQKYDYV